MHPALNQLRLRTSSGLLALAMGGAAVATVAPGQALAATVAPYHVASNVQCFNGAQGRTVVAFAPSTMRSVTGSIEVVQWSSDLYRWTGTAWALYDSRAGWLNAAANGNGLLSSNGAIWNNASTGRQQNSWTYAYLPAGHYAIRQFFYWNYNGTQAAEWSGTYNNTSSGYCTM
jgi:hypothetical protein